MTARFRTCSTLRFAAIECPKIFDSLHYPADLWKAWIGSICQRTHILTQMGIADWRCSVFEVPRPMFSKTKKDDNGAAPVPPVGPRPRRTRSRRPVNPTGDAPTTVSPSSDAPSRHQPRQQQQQQHRLPRPSLLHPHRRSRRHRRPAVRHPGRRRQTRSARAAQVNCRLEPGAAPRRNSPEGARPCKKPVN